MIWFVSRQFEILLLFFIQFPANVLGWPIVQMTYCRIMTEKRQIHLVRHLKLIRKELWRLRQKIMVIISICFNFAILLFVGYLKKRRQFEILLLFFIQFPANVLGWPIVQMTYCRIMTEKRHIHLVRHLKTNKMRLGIEDPKFHLVLVVWY